MRTSHLTAILIANVLGVTALETIAQYTANIPSCSFSAFKKAMESENCNVDDVNASSFECLCDHSSAIAIAVARSVDSQCSADFAQAMGSACGIWMVDGSAASDFPKATSILGEDLDGSGSSGSSSSASTSVAAESTGSGSSSGSASSGSSAVSATGTAAAATSTNSNNGATLPTGVSGLVGLVGGAAAVAGMLL